MDKAYREQFGAAKWNRPPSDASNSHLRQDINDLKNQLEQALASDRVVSDRLQGYIPDLQKLDQPLSVLDNMVPAGGVEGGGSEMAAVVDRMSQFLNDYKRQEESQQNLINSIRQDLIDDEDRLGKELANMNPNDKQAQQQVVEDLRKKYRDQVAELDRMGMAMSVLVKSIHDCNSQINALRHNSANRAGQQREQSIGYLDNACNKYEEVTSHLKEGINFWNIMTEAIDTRKSKVDDWIFGRNIQRDDLVEELKKEANQSEADRASMELIRQMQAAGEICKPGQR